MNLPRSKFKNLFIYNSLAVKLICLKFTHEVSYILRTAKRL